MPLNQKTAFRSLLAAFMLQAISIAYYAYFIHFYGYLPSPFVLDKSDTFMDLYNTIWWGAHDGRYTEWRSIYPPLNFIVVGLMRAIFVPSGVGGDPVYLRATSLWPAYVVIALHVIAPAFIVTRSTWNGFSGANRALIALVAILSPVFLFSIERGNLIVLPIFFLPFIFADRDGWWKPLLLAIIINLKPYFALLAFGYAFTGDWRRFLQSLAFAGAIFLLTGLAEDPNFLLFLKNLPSFADSAVLQPRPLLALPASPSALTRAILMFLNTAGSSVSHIAAWSLLPPLIEAMKTGAIVLALFGLFRSRKTVRPAETFVLFLILAVTAGIWAGGYSQIFYLAAVPVFMTMRLRNAYLLLLAAIFLPWDLVTLHTDPPTVGQSFITHQTVMTNWQLGLGSPVRPLLNIVLITVFGAELAARKSPPSEQVSHATRVTDLLPDWRFVLPTGAFGLIVGAALYHFAISSQTAVAVIRTPTEAEQSNPDRFLNLFLERRTTAQFVVAQLQTFKIANEIAERMKDPGLARQLAGQQYGGDGALTARLSSQVQFLEIRVALPDPVLAVRAAAVAADIAAEIDEASLSTLPVQIRLRPPLHWQEIGIGAAISPVISDQIVDLQRPYTASPAMEIKGINLRSGTAAQTALFEPAALSKPMIDSWWFGALIGSIACGSIGYAFSLSRAKRR